MWENPIAEKILEGSIAGDFVELRIVVEVSPRDGISPLVVENPRSAFAGGFLDLACFSDGPYGFPNAGVPSPRPYRVPFECWCNGIPRRVR